MEAEEVTVRGIRVRVAEPFKEDSEQLKDLVRAVSNPKFITSRRKDAIGSTFKGLPGLPGGAVLVQHEDEDGHGKFNGEVAAYFACELEPLFLRPSII